MAVVSVLMVVVVVVTVSVRLGGSACTVVPVVAPAAAVVSVPIVERDTDEVSRAVAEVSRCMVLVSRGMPVVSRLIPVVSRRMVVSLRTPVVSAPTVGVRPLVVSVVTGLGVVVVVVVSLRTPVVSVVGGVVGAGVGAGVGVGVGAAVVVSRRGVTTAPAAELVSSPVVAPVSFCTRIRRVDVALRRVVVSVLVVVLRAPAVVSLVACATPLAGSVIVNAAAMPNAKHVLVIREPIFPSNRFNLFDIRSRVSPSMSTPRVQRCARRGTGRVEGIEHAAAWGRCRFAPARARGPGVP
jgi:hypothetical protein